MRIGFLLILLIISLLFASGCSETDNSKPEPEQRPAATPSRTPIPEPECTHFWKSPDCHNPFLCYDCDETRGTPREHFWSFANFQEASFCLNCGEINGEPLEPGFTGHGFRINTTAGRAYNYKTITNPSPVMETVGLATLMYIDIFESDVDHPEKRGYEYIVARFLITFNDEEAGTTGFRYMSGHLDYFVFDPNESALAHDELVESDIPGFRTANRKLNFFGKEYDYFIKYSQIQSELIGNTWYVIFEYSFLAPAGYDGIVVYISNAATWSNASNRVLADNFDRDTLFFRLRTQTS